MKPKVNPPTLKIFFEQSQVHIQLFNNHNVYTCRMEDEHGHALFVGVMKNPKGDWPFISELQEKPHRALLYVNHQYQFHRELSRFVLNGYRISSVSQK